ncbi:DUF3822 family protein [Subsaximicrobium wynnwilliamsii]|uniref:DUF3822 family protein n=1 Tax=Subsaximicrobium wynnwilliamsii TaxID=291179 RepID=UPI00167C0487|nr:DUF3822 family protein [Subsaximicrobium wynnwilliamsii]
MKTLSKKALSIQISLNGLSFCILDTSEKTVHYLKSVTFEKKKAPHELLEKLKAAIETQSLLQQPFDAVYCVYQNELSCLVPEPLFDEENLAEYLKFNAKILKTDYLAYDAIPCIKSMNVFIPLVNINNYIFETFGKFTYKHASTVLIESLIQRQHQTIGTALYLNVNSSSFEMLAIKNKQLQFYNSFNYHSKEDFIYYLLFTVEQLKLDPEAVKLYLFGHIDEQNELFQIAYRYIRHVELFEPEQQFKLDRSITTTNLSAYFSLLNSFN